MILAEPLISYVAFAHNLWFVQIVDIAGRIPDKDDIDWLAWQHEMQNAALLVGLLGENRVLLIVHPPGYGA